LFWHNQFGKKEYLFTHGKIPAGAGCAGRENNGFDLALLLCCSAALLLCCSAALLRWA